jgi:hypothetical protein
MRESRYGSEGVMDYISTKAGRIVNIPRFGDSVTLKDIIKKPVKPRETLVKPKKEIDLSMWNRTIIQIVVSGGEDKDGNPINRTSVIELLRVIPPREVKRLYPSTICVWYENKVRGVRDTSCSKAYFYSLNR